MLSACASRTGNQANAYPTYDPFVHSGGTPLAEGGLGSGSAGQTLQRGPTPTHAQFSVVVPTHDSGSPLATPTPDVPRALPTIRQEPSTYTVRPGDTLGSIAQAFGVSVQSLLHANGLTDVNLVSIGQAIDVPPPQLGTPGPSFKVIPDSELVYGPASADFDIATFIQSQAGYLAGYTQDVGTETLTGAQVIARISEDYSVNPRLLLALIEHRSHWVTNAQPAAGTLDFPLGFVQPGRTGLFHQLSWAANELNRGYYLWRSAAVGTWVLRDGSIVPVDPTINAGTAGVENVFSILDDRPAWESDVTAYGFFQTYFFLFGNPFDMAVEPIVPPGLRQPPMILPFEREVTWAFTGGPHAAWDSGSAWGALDFAAPDVLGCAVSQEWVTAVADGLIVRSADGAVIEDLDGDGYEQTGWDVLYMHIFAQDRVEANTYVYAGDRIGHPSCEGGIANAAHLHLARKYNGEWISADAGLPFVLGGWVSSGDSAEYDGFLKQGTSALEAAEGSTPLNQIAR